MREDRSKMSTLELACGLFLVVFAIFYYLITNYLFKPNTDLSKNIIIHYGSQEITEVSGKKIDINKDMTFTIGDEISGYNVIEIKNKKVRIIEADCPDQICVKHSYLDSSIDNDMIICAPHKLSIMYD